MTNVAETLRSGHRVVPSQHNPWHGTPVAGSRWTAEQLRKLEFEARQSKFPSAQRNWEKRESLSEHIHKAPLETFGWAPPQYLSVRCPIIARSRDGTGICIITPGGTKLWVDAK